MRSYGHLLRVCGSCAVLLAGLRAHAQCKPGDPTGRFEGTAASTVVGKLEVSLDLHCTNGSYDGAITTPTGVFKVEAGSFDAGILKLESRLNDDRVSVDAKVSNNGLLGTFVSGADKGPIELHRIVEPAPTTTMPGGLSLTSQQWREDLTFFAQEIVKRHPGVFANTSQDKFDSAVAELSPKLDHLNSDEIYIGLDRLANRIGDAHTFIEFPEDNANLPLDIRHFGSESRIVAVGSGYEQALGGRVVAIGNTPVAKARELAATITPVAETDGLRESRVDGFLTTGMALHGLGITANRDSALYSIADASGQEIVVEFKALPPKQSPKWVSVVTNPPLSTQRVNGTAACTYLREAKTAYCKVRLIRDLGEPEKQMLDLLKRQHPEKVVIDLRQNNGGDYTIGLKHLIEPLQKQKDINQKGHLFVLIGPNTFSAAMSNAAQFRSMTAATLVGETIGERPNSYQESRQFKLPNSHFVISHSSKFYKFVPEGENVVAPDKEIVSTWEDFKNGRDAALDWILASQ
jgi:Peptidase family S41